MATQQPTASIGCDCGDPRCPGGVPLRAPFYFRAEGLGDDEEEPEFFLTVRTTSWEWSGERTDLHDMFAMLWAMNLRARDIASVQIISILNEFSASDSEIYSQLMVLRQPGRFSLGNTIRDRFEILGSESIAAHELISQVFGVDSRGSLEAATGRVRFEPEAPWVESVRKRLHLQEGRGYEFRERGDFGWKVFTALGRGATVAEIGCGPAGRLKEALSVFEPQTALGIDRLAFRTPHLVNAVPLKLATRARKLLALIEGSTHVPHLLLPTETSLVLVGERFLVALTGECGAEAFAEERLLVEDRQVQEGAVFLQDARCVWSERIDDVRFEELVRALLERERGVQRIRQVGGTREADDGRDFLVDWTVAPPRGAGLNRPEGGDDYLTEQREVLVQVKVRAAGVGRHDLRGIRDTLDHYQCGGLLVVAFPRVTVSLFDHLRELRRRGPWWIEWWGKAEIEMRLRRCPGLTARFPDIVRLERSAGIHTTQPHQERAV